MVGLEPNEAPRSRQLALGAVVIGGDYQGLGVARSLGRRGIPVRVLDDERSVSRASRYVQGFHRVPSLRGERETLSSLEDLRLRWGLDGWVLYPTRDETVAALARHRDDLSRRWRVPVADWRAVQSCWDKRETYRIAAEAGIPHPRTWVLRTASDLAAVHDAGPFVVKPAIKEHFFYQTGVKAWRVDHPRDLVRVVQRATEIVGDGEVLVQQLVPGGGEEQYAYCALVRDGRALARMTVRRRRQHPSDFGRASTFVETVDLPHLEEPSLRFLSAIGYQGLVELEYKRDRRDGEFKLLDVNARTWGYHSLGAAAGVDFPYLLFRDQLGVGPPDSTLSTRAGVKWIRLLTDLPNAGRDIARGSLHPGDYLRTLRRLDTEAVLSLRDPLPWFYEVAHLPYLARHRSL
ncbi:ATP-grasp domain-containing protein [Pseudonocardia lutea]|uniref:ATP-grasp domain-containing protein n=1 Tax=Pseudonocardia lutea TaxID=2172015 RepID=A0ABW1IEW9_9PSEU